MVKLSVIIGEKNISPELAWYANNVRPLQVAVQEVLNERLRQKRMTRKANARAN